MRQVCGMRNKCVVWRQVCGGRCGGRCVDVIEYRDVYSKWIRLWWWQVCGEECKMWWKQIYDKCQTKLI